jgi:hypothetical protein
MLSVLLLYAIPPREEEVARQRFRQDTWLLHAYVKACVHGGRVLRLGEGVQEKQGWEELSCRA